MALQGAPYVYDISRLRVKWSNLHSRLLKVKVFWEWLGLLGFHIQSVILCWEKNTFQNLGLSPSSGKRTVTLIRWWAQQEVVNHRTCISYICMCSSHQSVAAGDNKKDTRQDGQCTCHTEVHLCNCCCIGKALSVVYCECVSIVLGIQYALYMHCLFICGLSGPTIFFHLIS
jgi:hypothetical protein